jgi:UDP-N-acetylmuramyl tripeptide synthase
MLRVAEYASRLLRRGRGAVIGGWVALKIEPQVLARVTSGRPVTVVTGTNGKTTTTCLVAEAIGSQHTVATTRGANMPAGLVSAASRRADEVVLEVDELYVARVLTTIRPRVLVLLNISRDQLDRIVEIRRIAERWRGAIRSVDWSMTVVANADDPLVVWAVGDYAHVVWIAAGYRWTDDAALCPQCGDVREITGCSWSCACGLDRPLPEWVVEGDRLRGPGCDVAFHPQLPGRINVTNAAVAVATAVARGVGAVTAIEAVQKVDSVAGRYATVDVSGHPVRLLLAKNPASWAETLPLLELSCGPVVIAVNSRGADGYDTSWLWDVPFEPLAGRTVIATGDRRWDLAVRLEVAGVVCSVSADPLDAIATLPSTEATVQIVATYTAFHDLLHRLNVKW